MALPWFGMGCVAGSMLLLAAPKLDAADALGPWCLKDSRLLAFWKVLTPLVGGGVGAAWGMLGLPTAVCKSCTAS